MKQLLMAIVAATIGFSASAYAAEEIVIAVGAEDDCESVIVDEDEIEYYLIDYADGECHYMPTACETDNECELQDQS